MPEPVTLVVTDLDGTVWDNSLQMHPATRAAILELQTRDDVRLIAATGRRRNSARRALDANGVVLPAVLLNGAVGFDFVTDELFHVRSFAGGALGRVMAAFERHEVGPVAYLADTTAVATAGVSTSERHLATLEGDLEWWTLDDLATSTEVLGLSVLGIEPETVQALVDELRSFGDVEVAAFSDHLYPPSSLMVAPRGVTKQLGIDAYCATRGLSPDRVMAIGDAGNDLAMLRNADVAVVVETATGDVRALANIEIRPPAEGGWADIVDLI